MHSQVTPDITFESSMSFKLGISVGISKSESWKEGILSHNRYVKDSKTLRQVILLQPDPAKIS